MILGPGPAPPAPPISCPSGQGVMGTGPVGWVSLLPEQNVILRRGVAPILAGSFRVQLQTHPVVCQADLSHKGLVRT